MKGCFFLVLRSLQCLIGAIIAVGAISCYHMWVQDVALPVGTGKTVLSCSAFCAAFSATMMGSALIGNAITKK